MFQEKTIAKSPWHWALNRYWLVRSDLFNNQTDIWFSKDLTNWVGPYTRSAGINVDTTVSDGGHNMAWAQNRVCMFGKTTAEAAQSIGDWYPQNGQTVTNVLHGITNINRVSSVGGLLFIYKDNGGTQYAISANGGLTWNTYTTPANSAGVRRARAVFKLGNRWFMQLLDAPFNSPYHNFAYSDEAIPINWTTFRPVVPSTGSIYRVVASNTTAIVTTNAGALYRTTDGMTWVKLYDNVLSKTGLEDRGGIGTPNGFILGINQSSTQSMIGSNDDGLTWFNCASVGEAITPSHKFAVGNRIIVRGGSSDQKAWFTDNFGQSWTQVTRPYNLSGGDWKPIFGYATTDGTYINLGP